MMALLCGFAMPPPVPVGLPGPLAGEVRRELAEGSDGDPVAAVYRSRGYRPVWVQGRTLKPEADILLAAVDTAADDGLDPAAYAPDRLRVLVRAAHSGAPSDLVRADLALSRALAAYGSDLHTPKDGADLIFTDPAVARPSYAPAAVLGFAARSANLGQAIADIRRMSPPYAQLREALRTARAAGEPQGRRDLLLANLERARALPAELGRRYILVDAAAQMLRLYEDGEVRDSMPVVVGKPSEPTPQMAGLIRYAVLRPYWNVPPDLVRNGIARHVLREGTGYLEAQNMEVLSDWSADAVAVDPNVIDWAAVAAGRTVLRMRQRPGGQNMMGHIKFMFPNRLGVYLHDTPLRGFFAQAQRTESAGCVRLGDAPRLAQWLAPAAAAELDAPGAPEQRVDLPEPTPVYIVYFTAAPAAGGVEIRKDIYGRDPPLLAQLADHSGPDRLAGISAGRRAAPARLLASGSPRA